MNALAEVMGQIGFKFWDQEIIEHARWMAERTGRRRRVTYDRLRGVWVIRPAVERGPRQ